MRRFNAGEMNEDEAKDYTTKTDNQRFIDNKDRSYGGSKYQGGGGVNMGLGGVIGQDLELSENVANWLPGSGEVIDAKNSMADFAKGDIVGGVSNLAGFAIPFVPGRLIKKGVNSFIDKFPGFKTFGNPFDKVSTVTGGSTKVGKISKKAKDLKKKANRAKTNYEYVNREDSSNSQEPKG